MRRLACWMVVMAAVAGVGEVAGADAPAMKSVPLLDCGGLPCVAATTAGGQKLKVLIDTGNVSSVLDAGIAKADQIATTPVTGKDGKVVTAYQRAELKDVRLGGVALGDVPVLVMDVQEFVKQNEMPAADGTLSYRVFKDRVLEIDYKERVVRVSEILTQPVACAGNCGTIEYITFGKKGPPIVVAKGFTVNGKALSAQLDTMFSGTMLMYPEGAERLALEASASAEKRRFPYTDGGVEMIESEAGEEGFGDRALARKAHLYFVTPEVHSPDGLFDATVGIELLNHARVTLNFHDLWIAVGS